MEETVGAAPAASAAAARIEPASILDDWQVDEVEEATLADDWIVPAAVSVRTFFFVSFRLGFVEFYSCPLDFSLVYWVLPIFTGFYLVLPGFS